MKNRKSILIVDDEELFATILRRLLEREGYIISYCNKPSDAILLSQKRKFDIIVTDYNMPEMNGADFTRAMRNRFDDSFIIGLSSERRESAFLAAGANAFFEKPIEYRELSSMIGKYKTIPVNEEVENRIAV